MNQLKKSIKILFFVRRYNDVDQIVPIAYRMAKDRVGNIEVLCVNPTMDLENDFRLGFLKDQFQTPVKYVYEAYGRIPKYHDAMYIPILAQIHHLDTGFYERFFPEYLDWEDREHMKIWHSD